MSDTKKMTPKQSLLLKALQQRARGLRRELRDAAERLRDAEKDLKSATDYDDVYAPDDAALIAKLYDAAVGASEALATRQRSLAFAAEFAALVGYTEAALAVDRPELQNEEGS